MAKKKEEVRISNYELNDYRYNQFWQGRQYEHQAEVRLLKSWLKLVSGDWFLDIGGAYGRLLPLYGPKFHQAIILDYSTNELADAKNKIKENRLVNINLLAANLYHIPLADNSINGGISVRVMHHVEDIPRFARELNRILKPGSLFILEFANKFNLNAILRNLFRLNLKFFFGGIFHQPLKSSSQGIDAKKGQVSLIYNYSYGYMKRVFKQAGFKIRRKRAVSFFRIPFIKKIIPLKILNILEAIWQTLFGWLPWTPSLFILIEKIGTNSGKAKVRKDLGFEGLFVCPVDNKELKRTKKGFSCSTCNKQYSLTKGIWDFREPRPETVNY